MISTLRRGLLVLLAALPLMANAVAAPSAHDLVQDTTDRLLADLAALRDAVPDGGAAMALRSDPESAQIGAVEAEALLKTFFAERR